MTQQTILRTAPGRYLIANTLYVSEADRTELWPRPTSSSTPSWEVRKAAGALLCTVGSFQEALDYALDITSAAHEATITQVGTTGYLLAAPPEGYLVTCPHGCNLGTTAHAPDLDAARRRVQMHRDATSL